MKDDTDYQLNGSSLVHAPGMFRWCLRTTNGDINKIARDEAARLYYLAATWPEMPAGVLLGLARNEEDFVITLDEKENAVTVAPKEEA